MSKQKGVGFGSHPCKKPAPKRSLAPFPNAVTLIKVKVSGKKRRKHRQRPYVIQNG